MLAQPIRILLVGGDATLASALRESVSRHAPAEVAVAEPQRVAARAIAVDPSIVVVDATGGAVHPLATLGVLRESVLTAGLPVLVRLPGDDAELRRACREQGAADVLAAQPAVDVLAIRCIVLAVVTPVERARRLARREVTDLQIALRDRERDVGALSRVDPLTGRPNREAFVDRFLEEWTRARRELSSLGLMLVGLTHLRGWTREHGRERAAELMRLLVAALEGVARRPGDFVARYGPDSFGLLLPDTPALGLKHVGYDVLDAFRRLGVEDEVGDDAWPRLSVALGGASTRPIAGMRPGDHLGRAEDALDQARLGGPDALVITAAGHLSLVETASR